MNITIFDSNHAGRLTKVWHNRFRLVLEQNGIDVSICSPSTLNDVLEQVEGSDALVSRWADNLWNHYFSDVVMAKIKRQRKPSWPDYNAFSIYDDKIKTFVLLDEMGVSIPKTKVLIRPDVTSAIEALGSPLLLKKRHGSGSAGIELVKDGNELGRILKRVCSRGYRGSRSKRPKSGVRDYLHSMKRKLFEKTGHPCEEREWGIILLQEFVEGNSGDVKVVVLNDKALVIERYNRPGDFRASGSGRINYYPKRDVSECVRLAFEISRRQNFVSMGYDFVFDSEDNPLVVDMNYTFSDDAFSKCPGYYDSDMVFHKWSRWPQTEILEALLSQPLEDPSDVEMRRLALMRG